MPAAKTQKEKPVSSKKAMSSKTKATGLGRPAGVSVAKKPMFSREDSLQIYIFRQLKKVHPEMGISKSAMLSLNSMILDIYRKVSRAATELSRSNKSMTLSANDIQSAVKLCIPGEIGKLSVSEGTKALTHYNQS